MRVEGAIFLRAEYTEQWAWQSLDGPTTAELLRPGSQRVTLFHVVAAGCCWVQVHGGDTYWADAGDVIVLPYGDQHSMGGREPAQAVPISTFMSPPPWDQFPVLTHGNGGARTDIVCGFLHCGDPLFDPRVRALPPLLVVRPDPAAAAWVRASIDYAMSGAGVSTRIPELLLREVLRIHLQSASGVDAGWYAALRDPILGPALGHMHAAPERKWTVADVAAEVGVSRSMLDARFRASLGCSPMRYLTDWRMHNAEELLRTTDLTVMAVARRVGYDSEEAFSRAFKRLRGRPPSAVRTLSL
jgi:AraC-like DNA-binding protein